jgi:hypothetical protein
MPSSYTSLLKFELPVQGELSGTWGNVVNTAITTPVSEAIAGTTSITVGATDYTLTNGDGSTSNEARRMFITAIGSPGAARNVICPATSKLYVFTNSTSGGFAMTLKTSAGSGIAVPAGQSRLLYCNGTDVVEAVNGFGSISLTTALAATSGGTGQSSFAVGDLLYASSTTAISKLTVGATNAVLTVAAGIPSWVATLPAVSGGTGLSSPGTAGNVLSSNGTTWQSTALPQAVPANYLGPGSPAVIGVVNQASSAEVRTGTDELKVVTPASLRGGALVRGTVQNSTSGTSIDFTGIPSWAKRVTIMFSAVSISGSSSVLIQIGDSGGIETTGYDSYALYSVSAGQFISSTAGFVLEPTGSAGPAISRYGTIVLVNVTGNVWVSSSAIFGASGGVVSTGAGGKTLSDVLDRVRVTTVNGTDTFDAGQINILYE